MIYFTEIDASVIESRIIQNYEKLSGKKIYPASPEKLFLSSLALEVTSIYNSIDFTGKQNLRGYATGEFQNELVNFIDMKRLNPSKALATVRFGIAAPLEFNVAIAEKVRVTPDKKLFFEVKESVQIEAGQVYVDALVECKTAGEAGNGFVPGQISLLVDPLPYITTVSNTDISAGGAATESDENLDERYGESFDSFSVAGPEGAYLFWARTANQSIINVSVLSPDPGVVEVRLLLTGGDVPTPAIISDVTNVLADENVRPLTDNVTVLAPGQTEYNIDCIYYIDSQKSSLANQINTEITKVVSDYRCWQKSKIGRDINPDELKAQMINAGAKRVVIREPVFTFLNFTVVAKDMAVNVVNGGFENG